MMNILVVDDEIHIRKDVEDYLMHLGYKNIHKASTPDGAIEKAKKHKLDLMLMDINLNAKLDGADVAKEIKKICPDISLIYLTSYDDENTIDKMLSTDPDGYIKKPYNESEFSVKLKIIQNKKRPKQQKSSDMFYFDEDRFSYNKTTKELFHYDVPIKLKQKERKLFELVMQNLSSKNITQEQIYYTLWDNKVVSDITIRRTISDFNKKLNYKVLKGNYEKGYEILI